MNSSEAGTGSAPASSPRRRAGKHRALPAALVILLVASHVLVFFMARRAGHARQTAAGAEANGATAMPAKYHRGDREPELGSREEIGMRHAAMLHELEDSSLPREEFEKLRKALFVEWIRHDLRSALDLIASPLTTGRYGVMMEELPGMLAHEIKRQPRESWEWILVRRYGSQTPKVAELWLNAMEDEKQPELLSELLPGVPGFALNRFFEQVCKHAKATDLPKIRAFLASPQAMQGDRDALSAQYAWQLVKTSRNGVGELLAAEQDAGIRSQIAALWASRELAQLPAEEASRTLLSLPADVRSRAVAGLVNVTHRRADTMIFLLDELHAQGLLDDLRPEDKEEFTALLRRGTMFESIIPMGDSFATLCRVDQPELRAAALRSMGRDCAGIRKVPELLESLPDIPAGSERDIMLVGAIELGLEFYGPHDDYYPALLDAISDPEVAAEWKGKLEEAKRKEEEE